MDSVVLKQVCLQWAALMRAQRDVLVDLDSVAGDGDLGLVMSDGFSAVARELADGDETDLGKLVYQIGKIISVKAPSSMGTLLAAGFMNAGKRLKGRKDLDTQGAADLLEAVAEGVMNLGKAQEGEKTFLDGLCPAARALRSAGDAPLNESLPSALEAARLGFERAKDMVASHGRIAFRGEASRGIADPGAAVAVLLVQGLAQGEADGRSAPASGIPQLNQLS